mmetsp:Transcript_36754/g.53998  ORF Transcript_36754/g.53998 Transcript_36754/m.53998 type:complete len:451 (+) Transcript_36754:121-1473(+)
MHVLMKKKYVFLVVAAVAISLLAPFALANGACNRSCSSVLRTRFGAKSKTNMNVKSKCRSTCSSNFPKPTRFQSNLRKGKNAIGITNTSSYDSGSGFFCCFVCPSASSVRLSSHGYECPQRDAVVSSSSPKDKRFLCKPLSSSLSLPTRTLQVENDHEEGVSKVRKHRLRRIRLPRRRKQKRSKRTQCNSSQRKQSKAQKIQVNKETKPSPSNVARLPELEVFAATDVSTLRSIFGVNKNKLWGDLDAETTRVLYHALLPRALISLHARGLDPHELAPLAYEARVAAKEYARERCRIPGRVMAVAYDGFRHLKTYGNWSSTGLSWDEIWNKYECQIREEIQILESSLKAEDFTSRVCLRILERSCKTNVVVDRLFLGDGDHHGNKESAILEAEEVLAIADRFDREVRKVLHNRTNCQTTLTVQEFSFMRVIVFTGNLIRTLAAQGMKKKV